MGASSSSSTSQIPQEQQELESLATSTGGLTILQKAFSKLADPPGTDSIPLKSLQGCFCLNFGDRTGGDTSLMPESFPKILSHLGQSVVDLFFKADEGGVDWNQFLRGYIKCCGRMPMAASINILYRLYAVTSSKAGFPAKLEFESDDTDCKIGGYFASTDVLVFLWMCWIMSQSSRTYKLGQAQTKLDVPDTSHLFLSAVTSCAQDVKDLNVWDPNISALEVQLPAHKFQMWISSTIPSLTHCFAQYIHTQLEKISTLEDNLEPSISPIADISFSEAPNKHLLTSGRAWAISLTLRGTISEELLKTCSPGNEEGDVDNLLYRSSLHGRGFSRFWANLEGYQGPMLILVSASSGNIDASNSTGMRWVVGVLTEQGFENKDDFYGSSGNLYAISPIFHVFSPHGKEKNFIYSHLHPTGRVYEPHPKPVGLGFGGTIGNERISIDEDFARVTVRHHAVDKTYRSGFLVPNQGYLPLEASILDVEVWGLGGQMAKKEQNVHKNREQLFTEQRRKVDLTAFGWEDSPEKMMMDMVSNPNKIEREER